MTKPRWTAVFLLCFACCMSFAVVLQEQDTENSGATKGNQQLEVAVAGEVRLSGGRRGAVRIYTAPDGNTGRLTYGQFRTVSDARKQIEEWTKLASQVTSREGDKDEKGTVVGERVLGTTRNVRARANMFLIIRRSSVDCYLIESQSLTVALQVEGLIK